MIVISLNSLEASLRENLRNAARDYWYVVEAQAAELLRQAQEAQNADEANRAWFLKKVVEARGRYLKCLTQILGGNYYEAWCDFENVEIALQWLTDNRFYDPDLFEVNALQTQVMQWQRLYPYRLFSSPGILEKRKECSICHSAIDPWNDCGHEFGRVYDGNECYCIVTEAELLEISIVTNPVQKYSVLRATEDESGNLVDNHNYLIVRFVADRLASPFDGWRIKWTYAYHPHEMFPNVKLNDACPCKSGRAYNACCHARPGVIRPHAQIEFEKDPPSALPTTAFAGYGQG